MDLYGYFAKLREWRRLSCDGFQQLFVFINTLNVFIGNLEFINLNMHLMD